MNADYPWQELYEAAVLETDDTELLKRLPVAKAAIDASLQELQTNHGGTSEEREAIRKALVGLTVLNRELQARAHDSGSASKA
ncbi:MAG TPA: hypothetical protein VMQ17_09650 [Candidatus Sulfotelmatobacter sp.]|nr:hypothetical protein [Candidatus Sulfotelmatobacter sp.]